MVSKKPLKAAKKGDLPATIPGSPAPPSCANQKEAKGGALSADAGWIVLGRVEEIPRQGARILRAPGGDIAIFRTGHDRIFALRDRCPHRGGPLSQGIVHDGRVTCPMHNRVIDLESGTAVAPDVGCVERFPVRLTEGVLELCLTSPSLDADMAIVP